MEHVLEQEEASVSLSQVSTPIFGENEHLTSYSPVFAKLLPYVYSEVDHVML